MPRSPAWSASTRLPSLISAGDFAGRGLGLVAQEFGGAELLFQLEPQAFGRRLAGARPGFPRLGALALHGGGETRCVDADALGFQRVLGEIVGEAIGVVELEGDLARQRVAGFQIVGRLVEQPQAALQRLAEAGLLQLQGFLDEALAALELMIGVAHLSGKRRHQAVEQRVLGAEQMSVAHGAAHDPAQHIAPALVGGQHAVGDEEGGRAQVIGDDAVARRIGAFRRHAGQIDGRRDQRLEQIDGVIVVGALHHRGDALEPHAGIDRGMRQCHDAFRRRAAHIA